MTVVPKGLFSGCYSLKNIKLHDGITTLGEYAFAYCELLEEIAIPNSVVNIGGGLFSNCHSLNDVKLSANIKIIPEACFYSCQSLKKIELPHVVHISQNAFAYCNMLNLIELSEALETIGANAFLGCINISEIHLPLSLKYIGSYAFQHCKGLKDVYMLRTTPIEIQHESALPGGTCRINIPKGSLDAYQFTPKWKKFNYREIMYNNY